jgi:predicted transposase/invertase (TIGR01784 family)
MAADLLSPKSDYVFKRIFGDRNNLDILADFLKSALDLPPEEFDRLVLADPHLNPDHSDGKKGVLDVKVYTTRGKIIDVEIQLLRDSDIRERIVFYLTRMVSEQARSGEDYHTIKRVVSILITDWEIITENREYHNRYHLYDRRTGSCFTELLEIDTLELPKLPEGPGRTPLENWLRFLKGASVEELTMLTKENPYIAKAVCVLEELSADQRVRAEVEAREKLRWDYNSGIKNARMKGREEGEEIGLVKGREEAARKALKLNMPMETIMELTDLSMEAIVKLQSGLASQDA